MLTLAFSTQRPLATEGRTSQPDVASLVFIIDGDASSRESIELLVSTAGWVCETFASPGEFLSRPHPGLPCCLVVDLAVPGFASLEVERSLATRAEMPILCLMKPIDDRALLDAVAGALGRCRGARDQASELQVLAGRHASLTPRERQVMELVVSGLLNKQVGGELGISEITVKAHRGQVMRKMKADSLPHLVRMALQLSLADSTLRPVAPSQLRVGPTVRAARH